MRKTYHGSADALKKDMAQDGMEYGISIGRRAPMHRMHVDCIQEIADAGLTPVIFIGSTNTADSHYFDPVSNPLTLEQQKEQLKRAIPTYYDDSTIMTLDDIGDPPAWLNAFDALLQDAGRAGKSVVHYRMKAADKESAGKIKPLSAYMQGFADRGIPPWQSFNQDPQDDLINASDIRNYDLNALTPAQKDLIAAPDYIITLAQEARANNPDKDMLDAHNIPVTVLDLSFARLHDEAGISTQDIIKTAENNGDDITQDSLKQAASQIVRTRKMAKQNNKIQVKIASASCNQTGGDWPRNVANICAAIDQAIEDRADILSLEELGLTGYERGDDFYYSDNTKTQQMLQVIADYAASKDPNLVISVGHPWYFADKDLPDAVERRKNPLFNRVNNNFNVQTLISGGEIISMSAKRYLFNYERGYEKRHFEEWSETAANLYENEHGKGRNGTIKITLPEISYGAGQTVPEKTIPFGSPIVQIGDQETPLNLAHVICEEYWVGSQFDAAANNDDYIRDNPLAQKAKDYDISIALNPNASPPVANKIEKHTLLSKLASAHCGVLVHTDGLGSSGSTFAQFGSRMMAQDGDIISEGRRNSFKDMAYTSQVVSLSPATDKGHAPHAKIAHHFENTYSAPVKDGPAPWEKTDRAEFEEEMRNELLWMYDYIRKNKLQGITQALSGGADSGYNAAKVRLMVELACNELGVETFVEHMSHLAYAQDILDAYKANGQEAAIDTIMDNMLVCVYMGTDNSSDDTLRAARTLVEGGVDDQGQTFKGTGGKFHYRNVQRLVELYAEIYSGVNPGKIDDTRDAEIRREIADILQTRAEDTTPEDLAHRIERLKSGFEEVTYDVLSIANPEHQVPYENIQARLRQVLIMMFSNVENKLAISNPNLDEGRNSYATWGGDLHGGMISGNAHKNKARQLEHMQLLYTHGLQDDAQPLKSLFWTLKNKPSAELQPRDKDGNVTQFDEDQLGRSFAQMDTIAHYMLYERPLEQNERKNSPVEVLQKCQKHSAFAQDDIETLHDRIHLSYTKWGHAQFKIHGSPVAATYGKNVDHQSSLRTPNISANHKPELAQMTLYSLDEMAKRDGSSFEKLTGKTLNDLSQRVLLDADFAANLSAKMWTPEATDGRKMKIASLYTYLQENGVKPLLSKTPMAHVLKQAKSWRQNTPNNKG